MKRKFLGLFFTIFGFTAVGQAIDTLTPERKVRYQINNVKESSSKEGSTGNFQNALKSITNLAVTRIPYLTIAELRKGKGDTASVVFINQGGLSGNFRFDPSDKVTPDDSVMVIRLGNKRYKRDYDSYINVKWFGAKGDGITDDVIAIQKAIDYLNPSNVPVYKFDNSNKSGGTIYFPAGRYRVTNTLWISNSVTLLGNTSPSFYSKRYDTNPTSSIIVGDFSENKFIIQTQSIKKDGSRIKFNEATTWTQSDNKNLSITSGCNIKGLLLTSMGKGAFGGIRLCSATYANIENCGIYDTNVGIVIDDGLFIKVSNIHMAVSTAGIIAGPHNNSLSFEQIYVNSHYKKSFAELNIPLPTYASFNGYEPFNAKLNYNDSKQATAIFINGCLNTTFTNITFEGWDLGLVIKDSEANITSLYFEFINDTCIPMTHSQVVTGNLFPTVVGSLFGIGEAVNLTTFFTLSRYGSLKSVFKNYDPEKDPVPANSKILTRDKFLTKDDFNASTMPLKESTSINKEQNNTVRLAYPTSGTPVFGNVFTYGGGNNSFYQSQVLVSTDDRNYGLFFRGKGDSQKWGNWAQVITSEGGQLNGPLKLLSTGISGFFSGTGDGASYTKYNFTFKGQYGMGLTDFENKVNGFYNFRTGVWDVKGGYYVNGKPLKALASPNTAKAAGATYSQEEVQSILLELRDLKAKLKAANILN